MTQRLIFLLSTALCFSFAANSQPYLRLGSFNSKRPIHFEVNDEIRYQLHGRDDFIKNRILGFKEDTLVFRFYELPLTQIQRIDVTTKERRFSRLKKYGEQLIWIGPIYFAMASLNFAELKPRTAMTGTIISAVGWVLTQLPKKRYKITIKHPARIVL